MIDPEKPFALSRFSFYRMWHKISREAKLDLNINRSGFWPAQIKNKFNLGHGNGITDTPIRYGGHGKDRKRWEIP